MIALAASTAYWFLNILSNLSSCILCHDTCTFVLPYLANLHVQCFIEIVFCRHLIYLKTISLILRLRKIEFSKLVVLYKLDVLMEVWIWLELLVIIFILVSVPLEREIIEISFLLNFNCLLCEWLSGGARRCGVQAKQKFACWKTDCDCQSWYKYCKLHQYFCIISVILFRMSNWHLRFI